ncbi:uncharacterized protein LOC34623596 [Cyclospora cayetanensis]|uniref:Uncharacterized protein LOC34623596 n=1 Tax=Cyclospora cayetanensis TaxID=88456 RepID=A0A6P6RWD4_9EIME|nr:uncharacterized protein LOC34623596 [Cyclospora cayetanensis]
MRTKRRLESACGNKGDGSGSSSGAAVAAAGAELDCEEARAAAEQELYGGLFTVEELQVLLGLLTPLASHRSAEVGVLLQWLAVVFAAAPPPMAADLIERTHVAAVSSLQADAAATKQPHQIKSERQPPDAVVVPSVSAGSSGLPDEAQLLPVSLLHSLLQATQSSVVSIRRAALALLDVQLELQHRVYLQQQRLPARPMGCLKRLQLLLLMPHWTVISSRNVLHTIVALMLMNGSSGSVEQLVQKPPPPPRQLLRDAAAALLPPLVPQQQHTNSLSLNTVCEISVLQHILQQQSNSASTAAPEAAAAAGVTPLVAHGISAYSALTTTPPPTKQQQQQQLAATPMEEDEEYLHQQQQQQQQLQESHREYLEVHLRLGLLQHAPGFAAWRKSLESVLQQHAEFCKQQVLPLEQHQQLCRLQDGESFFAGLEVTAFFSIPLTELLLSAVFKACWSVATDDQRASLAEACALFLSRHMDADSGDEGTPDGEPHQKQQQQQMLQRSSSTSSCSKSRVLQPFLQALLQLDPLPLLPVEVLQHLALHSNCSHEALQLLQHSYLHAVSVSAEAAAAAAGGSASAAAPSPLTPSTTEPLNSQQEQQQQQQQEKKTTSLDFGLSKLHFFDDSIDYDHDLAASGSTAAEGQQQGDATTVAAYKLQQQQYASLARKAAAVSIDLTECAWHAAGYGRAARGEATLRCRIAKMLRERLWIDCCRELNRWNSLHEVAQAAARRSRLSLQCAAKLQHWGEIDRLMQTHHVSEPATKLCQIFVFYMSIDSCVSHVCVWQFWGCGCMHIPVAARSSLSKGAAGSRCTAMGAHREAAGI